MHIHNIFLCLSQIKVKQNYLQQDERWHNGAKCSNSKLHMKVITIRKTVTWITSYRLSQSVISYEINIYFDIMFKHSCISLLSQARLLNMAKKMQDPHLQLVNALECNNQDHLLQKAVFPGVPLFMAYQENCYFETN